MSNDKLRQRIALESARLIVQRQESEYGPARKKAARLVHKGGVHPRNLPSNREIREEIEALVSGNADLDASDLAMPATEKGDRFQIYRLLLAPLEDVKGAPRRHPEGDVLYHSLQVFDLASHALPYDEEFLLAALLHDVGKVIDPRDHIAAGLEALEGYITERTHWLIEHHTEGHAWLDGTLGARAKLRLQESENLEDLLVLARCDRQGRVAGVEAPELDEALAYIRELADECAGTGFSHG